MSPDDTVLKCREVLELVLEDAPWVSPGIPFLERCARSLRELADKGEPLSRAADIFENLVQRILAEEEGPHPSGHLLRRGGVYVHLSKKVPITRWAIEAQTRVGGRQILLVEDAIAELSQWEDRR